jgi:hypothetical protein
VCRPLIHAPWKLESESEFATKTKQAFLCHQHLTEEVSEGEREGV